MSQSNKIIRHFTKAKKKILGPVKVGILSPSLRNTTVIDL